MNIAEKFPVCWLPTNNDESCGEWKRNGWEMQLKTLCF